MARPRYLPGSRHSFEVKRNRGVRTMGSYLASRLLVNDRRALYILEKGEVRVNGVTIGLEDRVDLYPGSVVQVRFPDEWPPYLKPTEMDLQIIYEDEHMVAVNKPSGIVVHPARGHLSGNTVQNGLIHRYLSDTNPDKTIAPAHRLDKDTSGVMVFSRTRAAYRSLTAQFATPGPKKTYLAISVNKPEWEQITVDQPLGEDPENRQYVTILPVEAGGKNALTDFSLLESTGGYSLIQARPHTGRGHQIRVHLAHLGLPIICDEYYNPNPCGHDCINRQALHAHELVIKHPVSNESLKLHAPLPEDMESFIQRLRKKTQDE